MMQPLSHFATGPWVKYEYRSEPRTHLWGTPALITRAGEAKSLAATKGKRISAESLSVYMEKRLETKSSPADRFLKHQSSSLMMMRMKMTGSYIISFLLNSQQLLAVLCSYNIVSHWLFADEGLTLVMIPSAVTAPVFTRAILCTWKFPSYRKYLSWLSICTTDSSTLLSKPWRNSSA